MSEEKTEADALLQWLESSGRALELRVIRAFRTHATQVRHSVFYTDSESGKSREVDVVARFHGPPRSKGQAVLDIVIECKTGKPGSQWVAFRDDTTPSSFPPSEDAWFTAAEPGTESSFEKAWKWRPPFVDRVNVSSLVTAHDGRDSAHAAIQQLIAGVTGQVADVRRHDVRSMSRFDEQAGQTTRWSTTDVGVLGLIVTTTPLYVADLDESNEPRVQQVDIVAVPTGRPDGAGPSRVFVLHENALTRVVDNLVTVAESL
jgi:hypothetical protein